MMAGVYIILGGMLLFATFVGVWDLLAERQEKRRAQSKGKTND
jgi:hypothetical protein